MSLDLNTLNLSELKDLAKSKGIKNISRLKKAQLIEVLSKEDLPSAEENSIKGEESIAKNLEKKVDNESPNEGKEKKPISGRKNEEALEDLKKTDKEEVEEGKDKVSKPVFKDRNGTLLKENIRPRKEASSSDDKEDIKRTEGYKDKERLNSNDRSYDRENTEKTEEERVFPPDVMDVKGVLEIQEPNNFGFLRGENYLTSPEDVYVSPTQIRRFHLKTGDEVAGKTRPTKDGEKFKALIFVDRVNGDTPDKAIKRRDFDSLIPIYPEERLYLEVMGQNDLTTRMMDLICPIGKGQRGLIVAPPKAGKTTILKKIAQNLRHNNPQLNLIVLLIDERPEEVTDMRESIDGDVIFSTFDEDPMNHIKVSSMVLDRAKRLVEHGKDVVILLDSITRLSRAHNLTCTPSGRTLSGGLDPAALLMPKKFFGAARNIRNGGSLTILATALIETGSKMDEMIYEEFKGTGNMEVHLDRKLQERRIFPAIDIYKSGTRKEELLYTKEEMEASRKIRATLYRVSDVARITEELLSLLDNTKTNEELTEIINKKEFK